MRSVDAARDNSAPSGPRRRFRLALSLLLLAILLSAGCSLPRFAVTPRAGYMKLDGDVTLNTGPVQVTGSASDLGVDDGEVVWQPRIDVDWDDLHVTAHGIWHEFSGSGTADVTADVGGHRVKFDAPARTHFDFGIYAVEAAYDIIPTDFIDVGLGLGAGMVEYDIRISSPVQNASVEADDQLPFGYVMARVAKDLWRFNFLVNLRGLTLKLDDDEMTYGDVDASVSFSLFGPDSRFDGKLVVGYRYIYVDYEYTNGTDVDVDNVTLKGPFLGLTISF